MFNFNFKEDWLTSLVGLITTVLSALVAFGVINISDEEIQTVGENVTAGIGAVLGIFTMFFSKDSKV